jgi:hypothetical protein
VRIRPERRQQAKVPPNMQTLLELIAWGLTTLLGAFAGSYLGAYMKKKGENLATHEDIDMLLTQVRAVTSATKEIEAKISSDVWDRQKRWEVKRDVLFQAAKEVGALKDALVRLAAAYRTDLENNLKEDTGRTTKRLKYGQEWINACNSLDSTMILIGFICGEEALRRVGQFSLLVRGIGTKITEWDAPTIQTATADFGSAMTSITGFLRKELNRAEQN